MCGKKWCKSLFLSALIPRYSGERPDWFHLFPYSYHYNLYTSLEYIFSLSWYKTFKYFLCCFNKVISRVGIDEIQRVCNKVQTTGNTQEQEGQIRTSRKHLKKASQILESNYLDRRKNKLNLYHIYQKMMTDENYVIVLILLESTCMLKFCCSHELIFVPPFSISDLSQTKKCHHIQQWNRCSL